MSFIVRFIKNIYNSRNRISVDDNQCSIIDIDDECKCRYCYMDICRTAFISPCKCDGSIKYVHIYCLEKWRRITQNPSNCEICGTKFKIKNTKIVATYRRYFNKLEKIRSN